MLYGVLGSEMIKKQPSLALNLYPGSDGYDVVSYARHVGKEGERKGEVGGFMLRDGSRDGQECSLQFLFLTVLVWLCSRGEQSLAELKVTTILEVRKLSIE